MPRTRRRKTAAQPNPKLEFGITRGDIESCIATLKQSKYQWISNGEAIITTASEVSGKFLDQLAICLDIQDDPIALSIDNVPLYFRHSKILSLSRMQGSTIHESVQTCCYTVQKGEIIDMPDNTIVVFPLK